MPASYSHNWSILKAWKDWKIAHLSFGDSDVCSEYELKRIANYWVFPLPSYVGFQVMDRTQSVY